MSSSSSSSSGQTPKKRDQAGQNIQVFVRVRPLNSDEISARSPSVVSCPSQKDVSVLEKPFSHHTRTFNFDRVFCDKSKQIDVYQSVVNPLIKQVLKGYNCTVFAYGQTGTGKTYTMEGLKDYNGSWEQDPDAGIIPRSLVEIFNARQRGGFDKDNFQIKVSFLELYNEDIFDLLCKGMDLDRKLKIFEDSSKKGSVIVQGLEEVVVQSKESVLKILEEGSLKRQTAATKMNATSSRSHTIFSITVTITEKSIVGQEKYIEGKLNLVDLAGSENIGRSGAVDRRAREAGKINESLLTLGRVINSLVKRESHIPYRESKLTRLLQDSLGGRTKTSIIATVSPASINMEETLSTLDYAHKAKNITNRPEVNQKIPVASKLAEMQSRVDQIRKELEEQRERDGGVFMSQEKKDEMEKKLLELEQLRKEYMELSTLFSLKSADNDRLNNELSDTIQQLEEKSAILFKTQEEKEIQEHLVSRHTETEDKISKQALELRDVADQQFSDLEKLQDVRERKSNLEELNSKASVHYQALSGKRNDQLGDFLDERRTLMVKMCDTFSDQRQVVTKKSKVAMQKSVGNLTTMDTQVKEAMENISSLSADHINSEQLFLSQSVKNAQNLKEEAMSRFQARQAKSSATAREKESSVGQLKTINTTAMDNFREFVTATKEEHLASMKNHEGIIEESLGLQRKHHIHEKASCVEMRKEIDELQELISSYKTERDAVSSSIKTLQTVVDGIEQKMEKATMRVQHLADTMSKIDEESTKGMKVAESTAETLKQVQSTELLALEETTKRARDEIIKHCQHQTAIVDEITKIIQSDCALEGIFIAKCQESEKVRHEQYDSNIRERLEEAPKQLLQVQDLSNTVQKLSADSLVQLGKLAESHTDELHLWCEDSIKDADLFCKQISDLDEESRRVLEEARTSEAKFFSQELKRDAPTGQTPARQGERAYPRQLVAGTPDEERVRRYRQGRDLGAAMRLQIVDDDEEGSEGDGDDSVISGSTNVSDFPSRATSSLAYSSQVTDGQENISIESEEVGYVSDRENKDPEFAHPGSKLKQPKIYPASSAVNRTRSSSRNRNALGSTN